MAALPLLRRFWPFIAAALALLALWGWHSSKVSAAYRDGVKSERAAWQKASAELLARRQADKTRAETKDTAARADTDRRLAPIREKVIRYVQTADACPDDAGRELLNDAIAAANPDASAKGGGGLQGDAVPD